MSRIAEAYRKSSDAPTPDDWAIQGLVETALVLLTES
jgi:hypothetical protein